MTTKTTEPTRYQCHVLNCDCAGAMHGRRAADAANAYAHLRGRDDRMKAIWLLESALDALQHPDADTDPEVYTSALVCAKRLDQILFPEIAD